MSGLILGAFLMGRAFYDLRLKMCYFCPLAYKNSFYFQCPNKYLLQQVMFDLQRVGELWDLTGGEQ